MARLAARHCTSLKKGTKPIRESVAQSLLNQLNSAWRISKNKKAIQRTFEFRNFHQTVGFVNAVAWIANRENHHPHLTISSNSCEVSYSSQVADGLTVNDFICAAKVDLLIRKGHDSNKAQPAITSQPAKDNIKGDALTFNAAEADALLKKEPPKAPPPVIHDEEEDEFLLIDSDEVANVKQGDMAQDSATKAAAKPQPAKSQQPAKAESKAAPQQTTRPEPSAMAQSKPEKETTPQKETSAPRLGTTGTVIEPIIARHSDNQGKTEPAKSDIDLMATLILPPPGSAQNHSQPKARDPDEEPTVIPPDTTATAEIDDSKLPEEDKQETTSKKSPPEENLMERTLILAPHQVEKITAAVKTGEFTGTPVKTEAENKKAEENSEKTMLLSSDPSKFVNQRPPQRNQDGRQPESRPSPGGSGSEEKVEKTMTLSSDPTHAVNRQTATQTEKKADTEKEEKHKSDPGIEDDETLVMHSNTYKPVQKND